MKKIILSVLGFFISSYLCLAQTEKDTWMVGGSANLSWQSGEYISSLAIGSQKALSLSLSPDLRYFVVDRLAVGLRVPLLYSTYSQEGEGRDPRTFDFGFGPSVRYYFPMGEQWAFLTDISYDFGWNTSRGRYVENGIVVETTRRGTYNNFELAAGPTFFITKNVGLEALLSYSSRRYNPDPAFDYRSNSGSLSLNIGLQIYLGQTKE